MALRFNIIPKFSGHERFLSKVRIDLKSNCWNWTGYVNRYGYGTMAITGKIYDTKKYYVHRVSYSLFNKEITIGLDIDHMCMNKRCVNPDHLREVTRKTNLTENTTETSAPFLRKRMRFCKRGHEYKDDSFYRRKDGGRECKECNKITSKAWRATPAGKLARKGERERSRKRAIKLSL